MRSIQSALIPLAILVAVACNGRDAPRAEPSEYPQTFAFDLDAPPASYSKWAVHDLTGVSGVEGILTIKQLRPDSQYVPLFQILVGRTKPQAWITLQLAAATGGPPLLAQVGRFEDTLATAQTKLAFQPQIGVPIRVRFTWGPNRPVKVELNDSISTSLALDGPLDILQFVSTSGELSADSVRLCRGAGSRC